MGREPRHGEWPRGGRHYAQSAAWRVAPPSGRASLRVGCRRAAGEPHGPPRISGKAALRPARHRRSQRRGRRDRRRGGRRRGADRLPLRVKAQVLIGGRGKAGGIKIAQDAGEAASTPRRSSAWTSSARTARAPSGSTRSGSRRARTIDDEYYASVILDRGDKKLLAMLSAHGRHGRRGDRRGGPRRARQAARRPDPRSSTPSGAADRRRRPGSPRTSATRSPRCSSSCTRSPRPRTPR